MNSRQVTRTLEREEQKGARELNTPKPDSGRTLNKQARTLSNLQNAAINKQHMDAAIERGEKWDDNPKLRKVTIS